MLPRPFMAGSGAFSIYVAKWSGSSWVMLGNPVPTTVGPTFAHGMALDASGQPLVASAERESPLTPPRGLFVYRWNGTTWAASTPHPLDGVLPWDHLDVAVDASNRVSIAWAGSGGGTVTRLAQ